jgi:hypothetical protein
MFTKQALQKILKEILHTEEDKHKQKIQERINLTGKLY